MKKKVLGILAASAFAIAAIGGPAVAGDHELDKVDVCHVNGASDPIPTFHPDTDLRMFYLGKVINVAAAAVPAHVAHGDSATPGSGDGEYRTDEAGLANVRLSAANNDLKAWKQADCFITRFPETNG